MLVKKKDDNQFYAVKKSQNTKKNGNLGTVTVDNEIAITKHLFNHNESHPNIVQYFHNWKWNNDSYITMELISYGNLKYVTKNNAPLKDAHIIEFGKQITNVLFCFVLIVMADFFYFLCFLLLFFIVLSDKTYKNLKRNKTKCTQTQGPYMYS